MNLPRKDESCKYSSGIICQGEDRKQCGKCGWNPRVDIERRERDRVWGPRLIENPAGYGEAIITHRLFF